MPNRVLIHPSEREYRTHRDQYDALVAELETDEVLVRLLAPDEEHGASWSAEAGESYELVIHVGEVASAILSTSTLIALMKERLRAPSGSSEPRRARLYLADGEVRTFPL